MPLGHAERFFYVSDTFSIRFRAHLGTFGRIEISRGLFPIVILKQRFVSVSEPWVLWLASVFVSFPSYVFVDRFRVARHGRWGADGNE